MIDFYDAGGGAHPQRDPIVRPLNLNAADKAALLAFLHALTGSGLQ